jgi:hypothetical protein
MTKRLNDVTPDEWDKSAKEYYKKLDDKLPDTLQEHMDKVSDDYWDDKRTDVIGQNGNDGLHYGAEQVSKRMDGMQKLVDLVKEGYEKPDNVSKPSHYQVLDCEVIDIISGFLSKDEFRGYCLGNIIKYRMRAGKKNDAAEDLAKADEYEKIWSKYYDTK